KIRVNVVDLGDQSLRNIPRSVRVFKLVSGQVVPELHDAPAPRRSPAPVPAVRAPWLPWAIAASALSAIAVVAVLHWWPARPPLVASPPPEASGLGWSAWEDQNGYQREFDRQVRKRWYPRMLEAQLFGDVVKYRGYFEPFPSNDFNFYSHHSLNDDEFRVAD